jgi:hypothetical protein
VRAAAAPRIGFVGTVMRRRSFLQVPRTHDFATRTVRSFLAGDDRQSPPEHSLIEIRGMWAAAQLRSDAGHPVC